MAKSVCFYGSYDQNYSRTQVLEQLFTDLGYHVIHCHVNLWPDPKDKAQNAGRLLRFVRFVVRLLCCQCLLVWRYLRSPKHDLVVVCFPGHFDVLSARVLTFVTRRRLLFDALVSLFDTVVDHRQLFSKDSLRGRLAFWLDKFNFSAVDHAIVDTPEHLRFFSNTFQINASKLSVLPVSANQEIYFPAPERRSASQIQVLHYSRTTPLHGLEVILKALTLAEKKVCIQAQIIGEGPLFESLKEEYEPVLKNAEFLGSLPEHDLALRIREADLCLGVFGDCEKQGRVVPNKVYQSLASGVPIITATSPALDNALGGCRGVITIEAAVDSLAAELTRLASQPQELKTRGEQSLEFFCAHFQRKKLGDVLSRTLNSKLFCE